MERLIEFEWDTHEAGVNLAKRGVSFEEARGVFSNPKALVVPDPDDSQTEDRFVIMGLSPRERILVVVHCFRSQRSGTREQKPYWTQ